MSYKICLEVWGAAFYLLNKFCLSRAERTAKSSAYRDWKIRSWIFYLTGLPAWVLVLTNEKNWIAAAVETGAAPAMIMGLIIALKGRGEEPRWLDYGAKTFILGGVALSLSEHDGIANLSQWLEIGISLGFLLGTYYLAKDQLKGYLWLVVGNLSCSALMWLQGYPILAVQQALSLGLVVDAVITRRRKDRQS